MSEELSPRQFAEAIGVSESSVRRWADAGRIRMTRTSGGHRRITRAEALRFVRDTGSEVVRPELLAVPEPHHRRGRAEAFAAQHDALLEALEQGRDELAAGLISRMYLNGVSVAQICDGPVRGAMRQIGERWDGKPRSIFVEHRATKLCAESLTRLRSQFVAPASDGPVAVGGAPSGDPYTLPSQMAACVLSELGFRTVDLGADAPPESLAAAAAELKARAAWIAISAPPGASLQTQLAAVARRLRRQGTQLMIGGQASARLELPAAAHVRHFSSMAEMASFAATLL